MTEKERELILAYIVNQDFRLEEECRELQARLRFRRVGIEDCVELMLAKQRYDDFQEFALVILRLLHLDSLKL